GEPSKNGQLLILDEPSAGLHPSEVARLNEALADLARAGASVVVVDHDLDVIAAADWVIDLGPGAGANGGRIVAQGTPEQIAKTDTRTGKALAAMLAPEARTAPPSRSAGNGREERVVAAIDVVHAREHNLREISTAIPHGKI